MPGKKNRFEPSQLDRLQQRNVRKGITPAERSTVEIMIEAPTFDVETVNRMHDLIQRQFRGNALLSNYSTFGIDLAKPEPPHAGCPKSDVQLPTGYLPGDGKTFGYLEAYREWKLVFKEGGTFELMAFNGRQSINPHVPLKAEGTWNGVGQGPGIYALKSKEAIKNENRNLTIMAHHYVLAKVALWGQIKEHTDGYRSEYCYPLKFYAIHNMEKSLEEMVLQYLTEKYLPKGE